MRLSRLLPLLPIWMTACGPADRVEPITPEPTPARKVRFDLRASLGQPDVHPVGVAVDPFDGTRYLLDAELGLFRVDEDGQATALMSVAQMAAQAPIQAKLTDVVAIGNGKFALTATNDGFLLDLETGVLEQHFCYEPGWIGEQFDPMPVYQLTGALTVDPAAGRIYAQPQTIEVGNDTNKLLSQVGVWNLDTGGELEWHDLQDVNFAAGGMVVEQDRVLLLAQGHEVHRFDLDTDTLAPALDLGRWNITDAVGLALDSARHELLVIDGPTDQLVIVPFTP